MRLCGRQVASWKLAELAAARVHIVVGTLFDVVISVEAINAWTNQTTLCVWHWWAPSLRLLLQYLIVRLFQAAPSIVLVSNQLKQPRSPSIHVSIPFSIVFSSLRLSATLRFVYNNKNNNEFPLKSTANELWMNCFAPSTLREHQSILLSRVIISHTRKQSNNNKHNCELCDYLLAFDWILLLVLSRRCSVTFILDIRSIFIHGKKEKTKKSVFVVAFDDNVELIRKHRSSFCSIWQIKSMWLGRDKDAMVLITGHTAYHTANDWMSKYIDGVWRHKSSEKREFLVARWCGWLWSLYVPHMCVEISLHLLRKHNAFQLVVCVPKVHRRPTMENLVWFPRTNSYSLHPV